MRIHKVTPSTLRWSAAHGLFFLVSVVCVGVIGVLVSSRTVLETAFVSPVLDMSDRVRLVMTLFVDPVATYGFPVLAVFLTIDVLFVLNALLLYRLFREKYFVQGRSTALNVTALLLGVVGLGCFSCGSVLFVFLLSVFGLSFSSTWVNLQWWIVGASIALFLVSIVLAFKKLGSPNVCE